MTETKLKTSNDSLHNKNTTFAPTGPKGEYWGHISTQNKDDFIFPSPVNLPEWLEKTAKWLGQSHTVLEVGPGKADLVTKVLSEKRSTHNYLVADISEEILDHARRRLEPMKSSTHVRFIKADLNDPSSLTGEPPESLDKAILVNVFGYLEPDIALSSLHRVLRKDGLLRITLGDHQFFPLSSDYDPETNRQYVRGRKSHDGSKVQPLGYTIGSDGKQEPFYGYRRNYSRDQLTPILEKNGFALEKITTVTIPAELYIKVHGNHRTNSGLSKKELDLLTENGGRPVVDLIARKK
jgi:ubiquinone/menaquinone biosynthesis C-methylase UbiE